MIYQYECTFRYVTQNRRVTSATHTPPARYVHKILGFCYLRGCYTKHSNSVWERDGRTDKISFCLFRSARVSVLISLDSFFLCGRHLRIVRLHNWDDATLKIVETRTKLYYLYNKEQTLICKMSPETNGRSNGHHKVHSKPDDRNIRYNIQIKTVLLTP